VDLSAGPDLTAEITVRAESQWIPGIPPHPWNTEWFFAKLDDGAILALKPLPKEFTYDYTTADGTYLMERRIAKWMQTPDSEFVAFRDPAPEPVPAPTVDAGPEIDATFAKIREIMEESKPWRNEYELADGDVVREDDRLWNGTKTSEVHHWDGTSVRKARAACGNIGLRFFRKGPAPRAESAPDAREEIEGLIRALAMAAWDEGSDAGVVWCPDADMTKRGVVPMTQEEGLEHSRAHFAEHGAGSPTAPFSIAMHNLRSALAKLEPNP
jgi:hypothetical protein